MVRRLRLRLPRTRMRLRGSTPAGPRARHRLVVPGLVAFPHLPPRTTPRTKAPPTPTPPARRPLPAAEEAAAVKTPPPRPRRPPPKPRPTRRTLPRRPRRPPRKTPRLRRLRDRPAASARRCGPWTPRRPRGPTRREAGGSLRCRSACVAGRGPTRTSSVRRGRPRRAASPRRMRVLFGRLSCAALSAYVGARGRGSGGVPEVASMRSSEALRAVGRVPRQSARQIDERRARRRGPCRGSAGRSRSSSMGMPSRRVDGSTGSSEAIIAHTWGRLSPRNAGLPVSASYSTAPSDQTSAR